MTDTLLEVKGLTVSFGGEENAVEDVSFELKKGEFLTVIGASGGGKSTVAKSIIKMLDDKAKVTGGVFYNGQDIHQEYADDPSTLRKKFGYAMQEARVFGTEIWKDITYPAYVRGLIAPGRLGMAYSRLFDSEAAQQHLSNLPTRRELAIDLSTRVGLYQQIGDRIFTMEGIDLSGGQKQRLCIGRALVGGPDIIIMDEPTGALDPIAIAHIEEVIKDLNRQGIAIILVTHNMQQAARIGSDRTAVFYQGSLIELDKTDKIFTNPQHDRTEALISGRIG